MAINFGKNKTSNKIEQNIPNIADHSLESFLVFYFHQFPLLKAFKNVTILSLTLVKVKLKVNYPFSGF